MSISVLPSMEHTFTIKAKGIETSQVFEGTFTYKRPNRRIKSEIKKTTARLNEDLKNLDEDTQFIHLILATLKHTLVKTPEWWQKCDYGYELYDDNVTLDIYKECSRFEDEWQTKVLTGEAPKEDKTLKNN